MSSTTPLGQPCEMHTPGWHGEARTPVVDGKYYDPNTGELRRASGGEYLGPPAVDIIVKSIHADTTQCVYRAARPFRVEALLWQVMKVVHERKLEIDSVVATAYAIRVILAHEITVEEFGEIAGEMVNGIWD